MLYLFTTYIIYKTCVRTSTQDLPYNLGITVQTPKHIRQCTQTYILHTLIIIIVIIPIIIIMIIINSSSIVIASRNTELKGSYKWARPELIYDRPMSSAQNYRNTFNIISTFNTQKVMLSCVH